MHAIRGEIDRAGMDETGLAGDLDDALPALQLRLGGEKIDQLRLEGFGVGSGVAGVQGDSPDLIFRRGFLEAVHHRPADVGGGHGFQQKGVLAQDLVHLGPQHLLDVAAGGRGRSHEHFGFFMRRLFQEAFFPGVDGQGDD